MLGMVTRFTSRWIWALPLLAALPLHADVVYLESGGRIEGRIVRRDASVVEVEIGAGTMEFPVSSILRIDESRSVLDEYDERLAQVPADDVHGWLSLGQWAASNDLPNQAKSAYSRVLTLDPSNAEANESLGRVQVDGRWLSETDAYLAQGYVKFEGDWLTPDEVAAIEHDRREQAEAEHAQANAREAEARAREAEARAREAQADALARQEADEYVDGYYWDTWPYYGYGPHPPIRPPRPEPEPPEPERPIRVPLRR
jgi:hypothetical protein